MATHLTLHIVVVGFLVTLSLQRNTPLELCIQANILLSRGHGEINEKFAYTFMERSLEYKATLLQT